MSPNDAHHETWFDKLGYRVLCLGCTAFVLSIASGMVYGFWSMLLSPSRCFA
ncbi:hypothetical protein ABIC94_003923 [Variovorax paradoxus]